MGGTEPLGVLGLAQIHWYEGSGGQVLGAKVGRVYHPTCLTTWPEVSQYWCLQACMGEASLNANKLQGGFWNGTSQQQCACDRMSFQ